MRTGACAQVSGESAEDTAPLTPAASTGQAPALPWYLPPSTELPPPPPPREPAQVRSGQLRFFPYEVRDAFTGMPTSSMGVVLGAQAEARFAKALVAAVLAGPRSGLLLAGGVGGNIGLRLQSTSAFEVSLLGPELELGLILGQRPAPDVTSAPEAEESLSYGLFGGLSPVGLRVLVCPFEVDVRFNVSIDSRVLGSEDDVLPVGGLVLDVGWQG